MHVRFSVPKALINSGKRVFEQQRRAAGLGDAVGDLGDLQHRVGRGADAKEFAGGVQRLDEGRQVVKRHRKVSRSGRARPTAIKGAGGG
jgi:hypothetical protein